VSNNALSNPLSALVKSAAQSLPKTTGKVAAQQQRLDRRRGATVILADISGSMESPAWSKHRKIDVLRDAVAQVMKEQNCSLIIFSDNAREATQVPDATEGSTNLAKALRMAQRYDPGTTLVISDGQPDNEDAALDVAQEFRGAIDVLYIGPDADLTAIGFMRRLAKIGDGQVSVNDISSAAGEQRLLSKMMALLPLKQGDQ
jgi:Mg-chelatase subunit ChlD